MRSRTSNETGRSTNRLPGDVMKQTVNKQAIDQALADVCVEIIQEPLLFFSEADVQQMLVERLMVIDQLKKAVPTNVERGLGSHGRYLTRLVHREYGGGGGRRVDVVIFDPEDVPTIDSTNLTCGREYLVPLYAFELGTEKTADTAAHLKNDLDKLNRIKPGGHGYIIHFFRDTTFASTGSASRRRTELKIEESFRKEFHGVREAVPVNIRILAILLRTGRNQKRMLGKCEIFDQQSAGWRKVNVGKAEALKAAVLKQLV